MCRGAQCPTDIADEYLDDQVDDRNTYVDKISTIRFVSELQCVNDRDDTLYNEQGRVQNHLSEINAHVGASGRQFV